MKVSKELQVAITAGHPIIYLLTEEELYIYNLIETDTRDYILFFFDEADGIRWLNEELFESNRKLFLRVKNQFDGVEKEDFFQVLSFVRDVSRLYRTVFIVLGAESFLSGENPALSKHIRLIKNLVNDTKLGENHLSIVFVSDRLCIPSILDKDILVLEVSLPSREDIRKILEEFLNKNNLEISKILKTKFISALQGLTKSETEHLLYIAYVEDGSLDENDIDLFMDYKKQIIKKNAILEYVDVRKINTDMGGLKSLKNWLERKKEIFQRFDEARKSGVDIPKGVFLFGMPGCGKSLSAKYTAKIMDLPLLRLDMGRILGPYLGQSEENLRKAIKVAEAISPSILWIDEIEKALSGIREGSTNDVIVRIFGTLLTWMQEKTKPVFVMATANDISSIPPEFLRKGRFDEIFFVDFPDKEAIKEIMKIHLKKRNKDILGIDFDRILEKMNEGYSGADIEAIISEAVERAFLEGKEKVTTEDIIKVIEDGTIKPISETLKDKIKELRKICEKLSAKSAD